MYYHAILKQRWFYFFLYRLDTLNSFSYLTVLPRTSITMLGRIDTHRHLCLISHPKRKLQVFTSRYNVYCGLHVWLYFVEVNSIYNLLRDFVMKVYL
jgi:hypothetical protein